MTWFEPAQPGWYFLTATLDLLDDTVGLVEQTPVAGWLRYVDAEETSISWEPVVCTDNGKLINRAQADDNVNTYVMVVGPGQERPTHDEMERRVRAKAGAAAEVLAPAREALDAQEAHADRAVLAAWEAQS